MNSDIQYHFADIEKASLFEEQKTSDWLIKVTDQEGKSLESLNVIFCSDEYLLEMNKQHLDHDYYTDVITFDYSEDFISGDIYISLDRVSDNANHFGDPFVKELHRVIVHGLLHLLGYDDKDPDSKMIMKEKEDTYLSLLDIQ